VYKKVQVKEKLQVFSTEITGELCR